MSESSQNSNKRETEGSPSGAVFNIQRFSLHDGPGIRTTVFLKGCPLDCIWCHNPEGMKPQMDREGSEDHRGFRAGIMSVESVMREVVKDTIFYEESKGGVTFSGGEPTMQPDFLCELLVRSRKLEIHTCLDTSGYADGSVFERIMDHVDLFLYDLKLIDNSLHRRYTGRDNGIILDNLKFLCRNGKRVSARIPLIPSITDTEENISKTAHFLLSEGLSVSEVNLLPYHRYAEEKYRRRGIENRMLEFHDPVSDTPRNKKRAEEIRQFFQSRGFRTRINVGL
ncbi:MAG: glycyl-radical enzyme activating protein [Oligoflexales bacterium]|nr:glycyl-radical enzyme activating protein [Oligoflexales bacterium]